MPPRDPEHFADLPFPQKGLDVSGPINEQPPETTRLGQNVRAFEAKTNRQRGGSRPGLGRYIDARVNGIALVQDINTVISMDERAVGAGGGFQPTQLSLMTLLVQGPALGSVQLLDGFGNVLSTQAVGGSQACVTFDSSGNGYACAATPSGSVAVTSFNSSGAGRWAAGFAVVGTLASFMGGAAVADGFLYVLWAKSLTSAFIAKINADTGVVVNSQLITVTRSSAINGDFKLAAFGRAIKRLAISSGFAVVTGLFSNHGASETQARAGIWSLSSLAETAEFFWGGASIASMDTIATDGAGNFVATGFRPTTFPDFLYGAVSFDLNATQLWENTTLVPDGAADMVYDPVGTRYLVTGNTLFGSATGNLITLNPTTGAVVLRTTVTDGGKTVALGPGGTFRFGTTTSVSNVPSDFGAATFSTAITSSGTSLAGAG